MRKLLTLFFLCVVVFTNAQVVNIPDSNFKKYLINLGVDKNLDGEIDQSEASNVTILEFGGESIRDLEGIRYFNNIGDMHGSLPELLKLNLSGLKNLRNLPLVASPTEFNVSGCESLRAISSLAVQAPLTDLSNLPSLQSIDMGVGSDIDISGCPQLKDIYLKGIAHLDISVCPQLRTLSIESDQLSALTFGDNRKLKRLDVRSVSSQAVTLASLDLTSCDSLTSFGVQIPVQTLNISGLKMLETLSGSSHLDNLIAKNCVGLRSVNFSPYGFESGIYDLFDVAGCINLSRVDMDYYGTSLDFSTCANLEILNIQFYSRNTSLNLKNGSELAEFRDRDLRSYISFICADEFEIASLRKHFPASVSISSYCSFFPGGNYNTIKGKTILDLNNNGCDNSDNGMPRVPIRITDNSGNSLVRYTASSGDYANYGSEGIFTLTPYFPYPYFTVSPATTNVIFDTANSLTSTADFCITPNGIHNDLEITFLPLTPARPGFNATYQLVYKNRGTTTLSGNVHLNFDNTKMNFVSATTAASQTTGQLMWNYSNLQPFENSTIDVIFNLLPPPVNNINDTLTWLATINPSANDETPYDNSFVLPQRVIGSFDPNDKQCLEGSKLDISKIGNYLHYQIRFQNEGTDTAFNVVVADTLSDKLDWSSFELISSSHPCTVNLNGNKVEFIFENIKLPYKSINEPASNGWVSFKIKPKPTVLIGDSLNNKAAIYFDFNLPVITNTATTIVSSASTTTPVKLEYFTANAERNSNVLKWKANCTSISAGFIIEKSSDGIHFSRIENITATTVRCQLPFSYADVNVLPGKNYYRIKVIDADGKFYYSKTISLGISKSGIQLQAISSNSLYYSNTKQQTVQLKIISADGKLIYAVNKTVTAGTGQISLPLKSLAKGVYTLAVFTNEEIISKRFVQ